VDKTASAQDEICPRGGGAVRRWGSPSDYRRRRQRPCAGPGGPRL